MAQPDPYDRAFNFANYQAQNPTSPMPGNKLDEEFSRLKAVTDQVRSVIRLIQRDDTALANRSVGFDQLKTEVQIGVNPPGPWTPQKNYIARDTVFADSAFYICLISHVSGVFATDLAAGKWSLIASFEAATSASSVSYNDSVTALGAVLVQTAIEKLKLRDDNLASTIAGLSAENIAFDASTAAHTTATDVQAAILELDNTLTALGALTGEVKVWPGSILPVGYLFCFGQPVSRTTYAKLFAAIGTAWGAGDGSTTFNVPDLRGRVLAGKDDMGGSDAGRLGFFGSVAKTLGAALGVASHVLTTGQMPSHAHGGNVGAAGAHDHNYEDGQVVGSGGPVGSSSSFGRGDVTRTTTSAPNHQHPIASEGNNEAHPNAQPTAIVNFIIKT